jgi:hypothetical protein
MCHLDIRISGDRIFRRVHEVSAVRMQFWVAVTRTALSKAEPRRSLGVDARLSSMKREALVMTTVTLQRRATSVSSWRPVRPQLPCHGLRAHATNHETCYKPSLLARLMDPLSARLERPQLFLPMSSRATFVPKPGPSVHPQSPRYDVT